MQIRDVGLYLSNSMDVSNQSFGELLRARRKENGLTLHDLSERLRADLSLISKWERGQRSPSESDVVKLAKVLKTDVRVLRIAWYRDVIITTIGTDDDAYEALKAAEGFVSEQKLSRKTTHRILKQLEDMLKQFPFVSRAWVFGSLARKEARFGSDVDLMVEYLADVNVSYIDQFAMAEKLSSAIGRVIDIVEVGALESFAEESAMNDRVLVYESGI